MAIFEKYFAKRVKPVELVPEHEAFFSVLAAAALCDRKMAPEEIEEIQALCHRLKMFIELPTVQINTMVERVIDRLTHDFEATLTTAIRSLSDNEMRKAAYIHALEIVAADRDVNEHEVLFLSDLEANLDIETDFIEKASEVIGIKNKF